MTTWHPKPAHGLAKTLGVPVARLYSEQDDRAVKLSELSYEAIGMASQWDSLPPEQQQAIKAIIKSLAECSGGWADARGRHWMVWEKGLIGGLVGGSSWLMLDNRLLLLQFF